MLKITMDTVKGDRVIQLEGRLAGPWVKELENVWSSIRGMNDSVKARVDLQSVTYVDNSGKQLLQRMYQQGGTLIASGCMTTAIVLEVTGTRE
ncbi:MAG: hypothetical protein NPIRA05_05260 [Nitrospirales bacterium]|nr:MAG: hypothetical protein NPIRA05_05260 [Nitrospirales bacterium]